MIAGLERIRSIFSGPAKAGLRDLLAAVRADRTSDGSERGVVPWFAHAVRTVEGTVGMAPFDVQILGALAMASGHIAEMQTGEGKTLTAVLTASWLAAQGLPVHVLTANDYLARRDAHWMGPAYRAMGLSVAHLEQGLTAEERRQAYACDVVYATANEVGFDFLRDGLALSAGELVQRGFGAVLVDECDSILIDEARIPLIIAGGTAPARDLTYRLAALAREMRLWVDYQVDGHGRSVSLTDIGAARAEAALGCANLYEEHNLTLYTAVIDALHAQALLRRDVDYLVREGRIDIVDEHKGRVAQLRRWPAGLQTALEAKEGLELRKQAKILGSITTQSLIHQYEFVCGMTGTASTQAAEFAEVYGLPVTAIPTNRPVARVDQPDRIFRTRAGRDDELVRQVREAHEAGRPVLIGTASVADSERLAFALYQAGVGVRVLNARNDAQEAEIVAKAGQRGAVTVSTNMAGRGTDIRLGDGVAELGGLLVIGTVRHEARRIDNQLRGRAGRQGDPGESRFLLSLEDDLMVRFGLGEVLARSPNPSEAMDHVQRVIEGQHLELRKTLLKYDTLIDRQRAYVQSRRASILESQEPEDSAPVLIVIDELWSDYLASVGELKSGIHFISFGGKNPLDEFIHRAQEMFEEVEEALNAALENPGSLPRESSFDRGSTWTYITTDEPLGDMNQRIARGIAEKLQMLFRRT